MDWSDMEAGAIGFAMLVLYALIEKVVVPLIKGRNGSNGQRETQHFINRQTEARLDRIEKEVSEIRTSVTAITRTVDLSSEILKRVERSLTE